MGARTRERKADQLSGADLRAAWLGRIGATDRAALDAVIADAASSAMRMGTPQGSPPTRFVMQQITS